MKKALLGILGTAALVAAVFFLADVPFKQLFPIPTFDQGTGTMLPGQNAGATKIAAAPAPPTSPASNGRMFFNQFVEFVPPWQKWSCDLISEGTCHRFVCDDKTIKPVRKSRILAYARLQTPQETHLGPSDSRQVKMECGPDTASAKFLRSREREIAGQKWIDSTVADWPAAGHLTHTFFTKTKDLWVQVEMSVSTESEEVFESMFGPTISSLRAFRKKVHHF